MLTNQIGECTKEHFLGSVCSYSCPAGTRLIGTGTRTCSRYGNAAQWDGSLPICEAVCDPAGTSIANGNLDCTNRHFLQSKCTATCDHKYKLTGSIEKICQKTPRGADWNMNDVEPRCEAICQPLTSLSNGRISCTSESDFNSVCAFSCNDRYQLRGEQSTTCVRNSTMENGVGWSNLVPYCEPICNDVPRIPHAVVSCTSATDLGSECTFVCERGFELVGRDVTTCMLNVNDGSVNWEHGIPYCRQMCSSPIPILNGEIQCDQSGQGISIGNECIYKCNSGYRLDGKSSTTCSVGANGMTTWDTPPPFCERKLSSGNRT